MNTRWSCPGSCLKEDSVSDRGPELKRWTPLWMSASGTLARTVLFTEPGMGVGMSPLGWLRLLPLATHWPQLEATTISQTAGHRSPSASLSGKETLLFTEGI